MKKIITAILLILVVSNTKAQTNIDSLNWELRALFGNLAKPTPPMLFNWDMAAHTVDSSLFVPINYTDTLSVDNWLDMYTEMRNSAYDTLPMPNSDSVISPSFSYGPDTINMNTMYYNYYRFKPDAMSTNLYFDFDTINNILTDKAIRPGYPYDIFKVFASSPTKNFASRNQVYFRFGTENLFYDNFNKLDITTYNAGRRIRVNFNEGSGWHELVPSQENYIPIYFTDAGKYAIEVQVIELKGENTTIIANSISYIRVKKTRHPLNDDPDQVLDLYDMDINVYNPCNSVDEKHTKTLIYVEGFDIEDAQKNGGRDANSIYGSQIERTGLADLRNFGYRIFVIDWQNSRIDMRDNARNLENFIEYLKCGNIIGDANEEEFVIIGESMGGIIANYALMEFEQGTYTSSCKLAKMHNTRLLITLDSPFEGAHIPMGLQKMAEYISTHFTGALAIPYLPIAIKNYMKNNNMFADGVAAKQLLMYHISTQSPLGPHTYNRHQERSDFLTDQHNLGEHPRFCKLVAASNGNMLGHGQTRYWDGQDRQDEDYLLNNSYRMHCTILGKKINLSGVDMVMKTDPDGKGNIGSLNFGTWTIHVKLKFFGLKFYANFSSVCNKDWYADMLPFSNSAGGVLDFNSTIDDNLLSTKTYLGNGKWESLGSKWGIDATTVTDGFHWSFVPVASAFDFGTSINIPFDNLNLNTIMPVMPFDVFYGVPGDTIMQQASTTLSDFEMNPYIRNNYHTDVRNDSLRDYTNTPFSYIWYPFTCPLVGNNMLHCTRLLNREIGDDKIYLENRQLPWKATITIAERINVNQPTPFYQYPNYPTSNQYVPSAYSKEKPYIIYNTAHDSLITNVGGSVNYQAPVTGPSDIGTTNFNPCCENYFTNKIGQNSDPKNISSNKMIIFPNPTFKNFTMKFTPQNTGELHYKIIDIVGKIIYQSKVTITEKNTSLNIPINLPFSLPLGQYVISSKLNEQTFSNKLIIQ